jgi:hypothetical protein
MIQVFVDLFTVEVSNPLIILVVNRLVKSSHCLVIHIVFGNGSGHCQSRFRVQAESSFLPLEQVK